MGDLLIRKVPAKVLAALRARARRHHRSMQAEALQALEESTRPAGAGIVAWLKETRASDAEARAGLAAIREARDSR